ncbi:MAG: AIR synthase [Nitrospirota bacterium]|nr:AIR synthase [Nitrospirota bacterium]
MGRRTALLPAGKLPVALLRRFLSSLASGARSTEQGLLVGPGVGLDAAALDLGGRRLLVLKTDPITFLSQDLGAYGLTINANDLATMGATPRWFLATLLLPAGATTKGQAMGLLAQVRRACQRLDVTLCGGHTEITEAVTRPVLIGCLLGLCPAGRLVTTAGARVGDALVLTKGIPIEAVSVLARTRAADLRLRHSARFVARCRRFLDDPGIGVMREARLALACGGVHAMHDPTEGGLSGALYELAEAAGVGLRIDETAVPILPEGARLCADLGLHPWGALASGSLLICADPSREAAIRSRLHRAGIAAARIGTVVPAQQGVRLATEGCRSRPVPRFAVDEVARLLSRRGGSAPVRWQLRRGSEDNEWLDRFE